MKNEKINMRYPSEAIERCCPSALMGDSAKETRGSFAWQ